MRLRNAILALPVLLCLGASSCRDRSEGAPVPRRYAYPRVEIPDTATATYRIGSVEARLSSDARVESNRPEWLTATYASLGATFYLATAAAPDEGAVAEALANRRRRVSLNLGGAQARTDHFSTPAGFDVELIVCREAVTTPVQFIATGKGAVVSGAFVLYGATEPADSLRPIVDILECETFAIARSLR